jgi:hypothetical protein
LKYPKRGFRRGHVDGGGFYIPFAATAKERRDTGDPRLSLEERYPSHEHYVKAVARAATELQNERLLLAKMSSATWLLRQRRGWGVSGPATAALTEP